jgi:hypothetical protein
MDQKSRNNPIETNKPSQSSCPIRVYSIKTIGSMQSYGWPVKGRAVSGRDCGPAAMECRPAPLSAVSGAPNPVPRGVVGAANVGWQGPLSAGLALLGYVQDTCNFRSQEHC